jgi:hypothetical protein
MITFLRHPELVSGSIVPPGAERAVWHAHTVRPLGTAGFGRNEEWTLKRVQGDVFGDWRA